MDIARVPVDFNEMLEPDLVLLSQTDTKVDSAGNILKLFSGKKINIYDDCGDVDESGEKCKLLASAVVVENTSNVEWARWCKWLCKVDEKGIQHSFDLIK